MNSSSVRLWSFLALSFLVAGCDRPGRRADDDLAAFKSFAMRGEAAFFAGRLRVEATISRGRPGPPSGEHGPRAGAGGPRRHMSGGRFGGPPPGQMHDDGGPRPTGLRTSPIPPVTLRLKLENLSSEPLDVQVRDVNSDLGHFAARPERLLLAPGQTAELDPMVSQLGAGGTAIPVAVELRVGGKTERQDVLVRPTTAADQPD